MENNIQHGDVRYLMIFAYFPKWINGKFYFWKHYFIKQRLFQYNDDDFVWQNVPIHIERYEYEVFNFGKQITNFVRTC